MSLSIDATTTAIVTLPEVLRQANVPADADGRQLAELDMMREAAQEVVEGIVGPVLWRTVTDTVQAYGGLAVLGTRPVVSITSVTDSNSTAVTFTTTGTAGVLTGLGRWLSGRNLTVSYVAGRTSCPTAIRLATLIIAVHLWQTQLGNTPAAGALPVEQPLDGTQIIAGYAIPNRAIELLAPYRLPAGIA
ncbi:hypothetical protein [Terrabacter terrigena]|uniref:Phage gp6-like head-tail connector protein n=1 Tax=Terrabacter terrigena TaxID=574718 RepID=A0ABW3MYW8_9MICO